MKEFLERNKKEIQINNITIIVYSFIFFRTELVATLSKYTSDAFFFLMVLPGFFSALLCIIFGKNLKKALAVGIATVIFWLIFWFIIKSSIE